MLLRRQSGTLTPFISVKRPGSSESDILNFGGFGDAVFHAVASFLTNDVEEVESVEL